MTKKTTKGASEAQDTNAGEGWTEITPTGVTTQAAEPVTTEAKPAPKKTRKAKASVPAPEPEVVPAPSEPTPTPAPAKKTKRAKSTATLAEVFKGYVESLEADGKSDGTIASYRMELALAGDDLGLETPIADITPERVLLFFTSDRVMKKRNGKSKSPLSIDKTRRVLRQALQYAATAKLIAEAPLPELAASH
jgi:hypothetical protein